MYKNGQSPPGAFIIKKIKMNKLNEFHKNRIESLITDSLQTSLFKKLSESSAQDITKLGIESHNIQSINLTDFKKELDINLKMQTMENLELFQSLKTDTILINAKTNKLTTHNIKENKYVKTLKTAENLKSNRSI